MGALSLPVLLALSWGIAFLLWWDRRHRVIGPAQVPWTMAAMLLVVLAMLLALLGVPGRPEEQLVRVVLALEALLGFVLLARRVRGE